MRKDAIIGGAPQLGADHKWLECPKFPGKGIGIESVTETAENKIPGLVVGDWFDGRLDSRVHRRNF